MNAPANPTATRGPGIAACAPDDRNSARTVQRPAESWPDAVSIGSLVDARMRKLRKLRRMLATSPATA